MNNVRTFNVMNQGVNGIGHAPKQDPPKGLDWNMWLGPAPSRPFNSLLFADSYNHCSFWDYSRGWTPGMAPHIIDLPIWALELGVPETTSCSGGRFIIKDDGDAPDVQEITWRYPNLTMTWMMNCANSFAFDFGRGKPDRRLGIYFHAVNATLYTDYSKHEIVAEGDFLKDATPPPQTIAPSPGHERQWLDSIKSRVEPDCSVNYHYKLDLALTLANISYTLGRSIRFDPVKARSWAMGSDAACAAIYLNRGSSRRISGARLFGRLGRGLMQRRMGCSGRNGHHWQRASDWWPIPCGKRKRTRMIPPASHYSLGPDCATSGVGRAPKWRSNLSAI
ncbi:MAG: hypothetical protein LC114_00695 [Bryobacterales bacterium]|nr:hypothetical protein [Bryobacterales bacterium]